jgi:hypothetical protein
VGRFTRAALAVAVLVGVASGGAWAAQEQSQPASNQPVSWDNWRAAKGEAEKMDSEGRLKEAYDFYLEYIRQADGLGRPDLGAWGRNNAAYMLIKLHKEGRPADLEKAKSLLEEGLATPEADETCKAVMRNNLDYVEFWLSKK